MPFIFTQEILNNKSILTLIGFVKEDIAEILNEILGITRTLCREEGEIKKLIEKLVENNEIITTIRGLCREEGEIQQLAEDLVVRDAFFAQFTRLKTDIKEFSEDVSISALKLAETFFSETALGKIYCFFDRLEKIYKKTLHGLEVTEDRLVACLNEFTSFQEKLKKNEKAYIFNSSFHLLTMCLFRLSRKEGGELLKIKIDRLEFISNNYLSILARNGDSVMEKIQYGCCGALAIQFFNDLKKDRMIPSVCSDVKVLVEHLSKNPDVDARYKRLEKYMQIGQTLLNMENSYRVYCERIKKINKLNPKVYRLHSYNQRYNPSVYLNDGLCMGGVRCWSTMSLKLPLVQNVVEEPNFLEHMEGWVSNKMLYHVQLNQVGFHVIKDSGDHVMFDICTSDVASWRKQSTTIVIDSEKGREAKISNEAYHLFIKSLFDDIEQVFKINLNDTTLLVKLSTTLGGHGIGVKRLTHKEGVTYHFFDLNEGEFYTHDFNALRSWVSEYFFEVEYHQENYYKYTLTSVVKKESLSLSVRFLEEASKLQKVSERDRKILEERKPVLLRFSKPRYEQGERLDDERDKGLDEDKKNREELMRLIQVQSEEQNNGLLFEIGKKNLEVYERIKNKSASDHIFALMASSLIFRYLDDINAPSEKILECIERDTGLIEKLRAIKPAYGDLEFSVLVDKARLFLRFPDLGKTDEAIQILRQFCDKVTAMKENFQDEDSYNDLLALRSTILKQLSEPEIDRTSMVATLQKAEDTLSECWSFFNKELLELRLSLSPEKVDSVALEEEAESELSASAHLAEGEETPVEKRRRIAIDHGR